MRRRPPPPARAAVVLSLSASLATGCVASPPAPRSTASPAPPPTSGEASTPAARAAAAISAVVVTSNVWPGTTDLLVSVFDAGDRSLADAATSIGFQLERPDGTLLEPVDATVVQPTPGQRRMYQARLAFDAVGTWRLHTRTRGGPSLTSVTPIVVRPDEGSPRLGEPFPAVETPTSASVGGDLGAISSLPAPDPAFYERSVAELLERGEPFLLTIDSVAFRTTDTCGAGLGHLLHLHHELPAMRMVHAEPYQMRVESGVLALDPPDGPPRPTPWAALLGAAEPPWVFVVGRDGRLIAKFQGIFGSDELRSAIETALL